MGSTGGGVWKTTDAGHTWVNVSDGFFPVASMGAIEVSLSNPNVIYAGTGSSKIRSNVSIGRGIYKSIDAGKTWTFTGLREIGQISTVRVHPTNPDMVYVAALRQSVRRQSRNAASMKTTDGGKTWKRSSSFPIPPARPISKFSPATQRALRLHVARPAQAVDHHQRRARRRHLQEHRWRRHLDQTRGRPAQ